MMMMKKKEQVVDVVVQFVVFCPVFPVTIFCANPRARVNIEEFRDPFALQPTNQPTDLRPTNNESPDCV